MTDASGASAYRYDSFSEPTSAENGAGQTVSYGYNADGAVTGITYHLGPGATWAIDLYANYIHTVAENIVEGWTDGQAGYCLLVRFYFDADVTAFPYKRGYEGTPKRWCKTS